MRYHGLTADTAEHTPNIRRGLTAAYVSACLNETKVTREDVARCDPGLPQHF